MLQVQKSPASCPFPVPSHQNSSSWRRPSCRPAGCPAPPCQPPPGCSGEEIPCPPAHPATCTSSHHHCVQDQIKNQTQECSSRYKTISTRTCRCHQSLSSFVDLSPPFPHPTHPGAKVIFIITVNILCHYDKILIREGVFAPPWCNTSQAGLGGCALLLAAHFSMIKLDQDEHDNNSKIDDDDNVDCILQVMQG